MRDISLLLFLSLFTLAPAHAQSPAPGGTTQVGPVSVTWHKGFSYAGNSLRVFGGVQLTSTSFNMTAQTVTFDLSRAKTPGASGLQKATAEGGVGKPVIGHFVQTELARSYNVVADKAVYTPAPAKSASTGTIDFTGHVVLELRDPAALDGPAVSRSEHIVMRLGSGPAFPQIEGAAGTLSFTPLQ